MVSIIDEVVVIIIGVLTESSVNEDVTLDGSDVEGVFDPMMVFFAGTGDGKE